MILNASGGGLPQDPKSPLHAQKVWENADCSQPFTAQTVTFSDTDAVFYIVEYRLFSGNSSSYKSDIVFPKNHTVLGSNYYDHEEEKFVEVTRNVTITESSAVFSDDSVDGEHGEYVVPAAIYAFY